MAWLQIQNFASGPNERQTPIPRPPIEDPPLNPPPNEPEPPEPADPDTIPQGPDPSPIDAT
jgi:hypothetical protein